MTGAIDITPTGTGYRYPEPWLIQRAAGWIVARVFIWAAMRAYR